jgi:hypothetical protein
MAPRKSSNPGRTARFYRKNKASYRKKLAAQKEINKDKKPYRRELARARRANGMMGKGGKDMCHERGKLRPCNAKRNRAKGGGQKR